MLEGYQEAMTAVAKALEALQESSPHWLDYYPQDKEAAALKKANSEHRERAIKLESVRAELEELAIHCCDFVK